MGVHLSHRPLSLPAVWDLLEDQVSGGVAVFVGRVRPDASASGRVSALFYEAHEPMAERAIRELERATRKRFRARKIVVKHRLGLVPVGAASVIVGAACAHRTAAFAACRFLIERVKHQVPIWKSDQVRPSRPPPRRRGRPRAR